MESLVGVEKSQLSAVHLPTGRRLRMKRGLLPAEPPRSTVIAVVAATTAALAGAAMTSGIFAVIAPHWPAFALELLFIAFGASAAGWNGIYLAEVASNSPHGMLSVVTAGASVWN